MESAKRRKVTEKRKRASEEIDDTDFDLPSSSAQRTDEQLYDYAPDYGVSDTDAPFSAPPRTGTTTTSNGRAAIVSVRAGTSAGVAGGTIGEGAIRTPCAAAAVTATESIAGNARSITALAASVQPPVEYLHNHHHSHTSADLTPSLRSSRPGTYSHTQRNEVQMEPGVPFTPLHTDRRQARHEEEVRTYSSQQHIPHHRQEAYLSSSALDTTQSNRYIRDTVSRAHSPHSTNQHYEQPCDYADRMHYAEHRSHVAERADVGAQYGQRPHRPQQSSQSCDSSSNEQYRHTARMSRFVSDDTASEFDHERTCNYADSRTARVEPRTILREQDHYTSSGIAHANSFQSQYTGVPSASAHYMPPPPFNTMPAVGYPSVPYSTYPGQHSFAPINPYYPPHFATGPIPPFPMYPHHPHALYDARQNRVQHQRVRNRQHHQRHHQQHNHNNDDSLVSVDRARLIIERQRAQRLLYQVEQNELDLELGGRARRDRK